MSRLIEDTESLYHGLKLRWEWGRNGACFREQIGNRYDLRPIGSVESVNGEWRIRLLDDPDVTLSVSQMLNEGYLLYDSEPFLAHYVGSEITQRLRGNYSIPVNDGGGPLDGSQTFRRTFEVPPIQHDAAHRIELLEGLLWEAAGDLYIVLLRDVDNLPEEEVEERLSGIKTIFRTLGYKAVIPEIMKAFSATSSEK